MGLKLPKIHGICHIAEQDILIDGVTIEFDTLSNESAAKVAALL